VSQYSAEGLPGSVAAIARSSSVVEMLVRRWLGTVVDTVALGGMLFTTLLLGEKALPIGIVLWLIAALLYYPVSEGVWGRTLGKLVTGMIVVDETGRPPGIWKAVLRTLLRLIEVNPFLLGGIPAGIAVAVSEKRQRLGDMVAQTYVVPLKALSNTVTTVFD
jgi:uncharacterized RDD family membrane protein YckC